MIRVQYKDWPKEDVERFRILDNIIKSGAHLQGDDSDWYDEHKQCLKFYESIARKYFSNSKSRERDKWSDPNKEYFMERPRR